MKAEELLELIGDVDEDILSGMEQRKHRMVWKSVLIAAALIALAATALAAGIILQSRPIGEVKIQTDSGLTPFTVDGAGNVIHDPRAGVLVMMETEYDDDTPGFLEEIYEITLPDGWKRAPHGKGSGDGWVMDLWENSWELEGRTGWILLGQTTARRHEAYGENCVDVLYDLNVTQPIATEKLQLAGLEMLKVTIPPHNAVQNNYCKDGENRLYWCDGQYIMYFTYPSWMEDAQVEQILTTLTRRRAPWSYPEHYGSIDPEQIRNAAGDFHMEGVTVPQYAYLYCDGCIWFGEPDYLMKYDIAKGEMESIYINTGKPQPINPRYLYDAGDYIGFWDQDVQYRVLKDGKGVPEAIGAGYHFSFFYDMWSYAVEENAIVRTHLLTGEKQRLVEGIQHISVLDGKILATPEGSAEEYHIYNMACTEYETIPRDSRWLYSIQVGDARVLIAEYGKLYLERNGEIINMGLKARDLTAYGGCLYYRTEGQTQRDLCVYDPATNRSETVVEGVFAYAILDGRYLACTKTGDDGKTRGYTHIFTDLKTGQSVTFDLHDSILGAP